MTDIIPSKNQTKDGRRFAAATPHLQEPAGMHMIKANEGKEQVPVI